MLMLFFTLAAALAALIVAVVFVIAWRDQDVPTAIVLGVVLFSLMLVVMVVVRGSL